MSCNQKWNNNRGILFLKDISRGKPQPPASSTSGSSSDPFSKGWPHSCAHFWRPIPGAAADSKVHWVSLGHWWRMWGTNKATLRSLPRLRTEALTLAFARLAKCNETFAKYPAKNWIRLTHISNNLGTERLRTLVGDGVRICFFWFMLVLHHFSHFSWCHSFITGVVVNQWYRAEFLDVTQPLAYRSFFNTKLFDQCPGWKQWEAAVVFCSFLSRVVGFQSFSEVFHQLLPGRQLVPQSGKGELENIGKLGEDLNSKCKIKNYSILSSNKQHESKMTNDKSIVCT